MAKWEEGDSPPPRLVLLAVVVVLAVAVAVAVALRASFAGGAVEHDRDIAVFLHIVELLELGKHVALQQTGAYHENGALAVVVDDACVGYYLNRRTVYEDVVVVVAQFINQLAETV